MSATSRPRRARTTQVPLAELEAAFSTDPEIVEAARARIIALDSIEAFYDGVRRARWSGQQEDLEFWLLEIVTSRGHTRTIATAIMEMVEDVLEPAGRWSEGLLYLRFIEPSVSGVIRDRVTALIERVRGAQAWLGEIETGDDWRTVRPDPSRMGESQHAYDALRAQFQNKGGKGVEMLEGLSPEEFLPGLAGFLNGMKSGLAEFGISSEVSVRAFVDHWQSRSVEPVTQRLLPTPGVPEGRQSMRW